MLSLILSSVCSPLLLFIVGLKGPVVPKGDRKRRFACSYMNTWPAQTINKKLENSTHRGRVMTVCTLCHDVTSSLHSTICFS